MSHAMRFEGSYITWRRWVASQPSNQNTIMNNGTTDAAQVATHARSSQARLSTGEDELSRAKRELLQAELRLAKARATAAAAEVDIKVIGARLKALAK
jgi:chromosome segregation ATPase